MSRAVTALYPAASNKMGPGVVMRNPMPYGGIRNIGPFVMIDHLAPLLMQKGYRFHIPPHPHKGFAAVSLLISGGIEHRDSMGNHGRLGSGAIQWMHAGGGVLHSETLYNPTDGPLHLENIQLWVNSPAAHKFEQPSYQDTDADDIPVSEGPGRKVRVYAGQYNEVLGPVKPLTEMVIAVGELEAGTQETVSLPITHETGLYVLRGKLQVGDSIISEHVLATVDTASEELRFTAVEPTVFLLLSGVPINEPIVSHGPFVMNTPQQIHDAILEYQTGKMGSM